MDTAQKHFVYINDGMYSLNPFRAGQCLSTKDGRDN